MGHHRGAPRGGRISPLRGRLQPLVTPEGLPMVRSIAPCRPPLATATATSNPAPPTPRRPARSRGYRRTVSGPEPLDRQ